MEDLYVGTEIDLRGICLKLFESAVNGAISGDNDVNIRPFLDVSTATCVGFGEHSSANTRSCSATNPNSGYVNLCPCESKSVLQNRNYANIYFEPVLPRELIQATLLP